MPSKKTSSSLPPSKEQIALAGKYQKKIDAWLAVNLWCSKSKFWISSGLSSTTVARIKQGYISGKTALILDSFFKRNEEEPSVVIASDEFEKVPSFVDVVDKYRALIAKDLNIDIDNVRVSVFTG